MTKNISINHSLLCNLLCITLLFVIACNNEQKSTSSEQINEQKIVESVNIESMGNIESVDNVEPVINGENVDNVEPLVKDENIDNVDTTSNVESVENILKDGTFEQGLTYWKSDAAIIFTNINDKSYCYVKGDSNQIRIYQSINVETGFVYRLSFDLKSSKNSGAYVVYRDDRVEKEEYFYCNKPAGDNHYEWEFSPLSSGPARIALSTYLKGDFYFSNVSLVSQKIHDSSTYHE